MNWFYVVLFFWVLLVPTGGLAQGKKSDTTFYDKYWGKVPCEKAHYFEVPEHEAGKGRYESTYYYPGGEVYEVRFQKRLQSSKRYSVYYYKSGKKDSEGWEFENGENGIWKFYRDSTETLELVENFKGGFFHGDVIYYHLNGKVRRHEVYKTGKMISGACFTSDGLDTAYYAYNGIPRFRGGDDKYEAYVFNDPGYIDFCRNHFIKGTVYVRTVFSETGKIVETDIIKSLSPLADKEALRIIRAMPDWEPAYDENGKLVKEVRNLDILFR